MTVVGRKPPAVWPPVEQPPVEQPPAEQPPAGQPPTGQPSAGQPPTWQPPDEHPPLPVGSTPTPVPQPDSEPQAPPTPGPFYGGDKPGPPPIRYSAPVPGPAAPEETEAWRKPTTDTGSASQGPFLGLVDPAPVPVPDYHEAAPPPPPPSAPELRPARPVEVDGVPGVPRENEPGTSQVAVVPLVPSQTPATSLPGAPRPENRSANAAPTQPPPRPAVGPNPDRLWPTGAHWRPQATVSGSIPNVPAAVSSAVHTTLQTIGSTAAGILGSFTDDPSEPSPADEQGPLEGGEPIPLAPVAPLGGGSYSPMSAGGVQAGSGGFAPLLIGILVSGLVLLRRDGRLWRAFCEVPKPSSALLTPLERPG
jgi:hypothetical protein